MLSHPSRRDVLKGTALACAGEFAFLGGLPALAAQDVQNPARAMVQLGDDIEPLVRLIEDTPRERLLNVAAERVRGGTSYQQLLGAVMLAGVRGIQPRPVGFKFHAVLVVNSAHLAAQAARDQDRWLPLFLGARQLQESRKRPTARQGELGDAARGGRPDCRRRPGRAELSRRPWTTGTKPAPIAPSPRWPALPAPTRSMKCFGATAPAISATSATRRSIVANSYRTLQTIGWRHAEPILRSLAYALLEHEGTNPAQRDGDPDRPYPRQLAPGRPHSRRLAARPRHAGRRRPIFWRRCAPPLRPKPASASSRMLNDGIDPASVWDALFLFAGELLMRQPGIVGIHMRHEHQRAAFRLSKQRATTRRAGSCFCKRPPFCRCSAPT